MARSVCGFGPDVKPDRGLGVTFLVDWDRALAAINHLDCQADRRRLPVLVGVDIHKLGLGPICLTRKRLLVDYLQLAISED